ncbi:FAD binding domain protein [Dictyocaulus viviparus]|uniref:Delta(24)-sterol reductase n=1 Tax=Dictyocaulus viviparus TaxID=29172 RepID=A0A0D8XHF5_DICVI|nr:FAD binding domain protein [Dictyocaulus viviparus]
MYPVENGWLSSNPIPTKGVTPICTGNLVDILEIDQAAMSVRVEPMVTMDELSRLLIPLGYCIPLLPAANDLTVQELINGGGVGTSGRKYGMFQHICISYELVMPDGSLITATREKRNESDAQGLFYGIPWSQGTLGILVAATLRLIPIKPFVKLTYTPTKSIEEMQSRLIEECQTRENEFVEGIQFSKTNGVVICGRFSEGSPKNQQAKINRISRWYKPWYYKHAQKIASLNEEYTEFVPLQDFHNRHSRSLFWDMKNFIPFGNTLIFRWLFGWMGPPNIALYKALIPDVLKVLWQQSNHSRHDVLIPLDNLTAAMEICDREYGIYPIWLCPYNLPSCPGIVRQRSGRNILYVNVGVYGVAKRKGFDRSESTKHLEKFAISVNGVQIMHGDMRMSRAEFWQMFDSSLYEWLRVKYNCKDAFFDLYEKICTTLEY